MKMKEDMSSEKKRGLLFTKGRDMLIASLISLAFTLLNPTDYSSLTLLTLFDSNSALNTTEEYRIINHGTLLKVKRSHRNLLFPFAIAVLFYNIKCLFSLFKVIFDPTHDSVEGIWDANGMLMALAGGAILFFSELVLVDLILSV